MLFELGHWSSCKPDRHQTTKSNATTFWYLRVSRPFQGSWLPNIFPFINLDRNMEMAFLNFGLTLIINNCGLD